MWDDLSLKSFVESWNLGIRIKEEKIAIWWLLSLQIGTRISTLTCSRVYVNSECGRDAKCEGVEKSIDGVSAWFLSELRAFCKLMLFLKICTRYSDVGRKRGQGLSLPITKKIQKFFSNFILINVFDFSQFFSILDNFFILTNLFDFDQFFRFLLMLSMLTNFFVSKKLP
jgi:hypothetical protein